jgi:single-strand DNA-binding protein
MSVNKVILVGNLGRDPEVRFTAGGKAVARFSVATSEVWNDAEGTRQERTEWHNVVVWKQAESCGQYLQKGRQVYIEARSARANMTTRKATKYITEVIAQRVQFLGGVAAAQPAGRRRRRGPSPVPAGEDIPF